MKPTFLICSGLFVSQFQNISQKIAQDIDFWAGRFVVLVWFFLEGGRVLLRDGIFCFTFVEFIWGLVVLFKSRKEPLKKSLTFKVIH